jgi:uncharacterized coiled-coil protein SlyX
LLQGLNAVMRGLQSELQLLLEKLRRQERSLGTSSRLNRIPPGH